MCYLSPHREFFLVTVNIFENWAKCFLAIAVKISKIGQFFFKISWLWQALLNEHFYGSERMELN